MGKQAGPHFITGTINNRCYYQMNGKYLVRAKSSLSRRRVKRSPAFRRTMQYAEWLAQASHMASRIYRVFEKQQRKVQVYRAMTGMAINLLKTGMEAAAVQAKLVQQYRSYMQEWALAEYEMQIVTNETSGAAAKAATTVSIRPADDTVFAGMQKHVAGKQTITADPGNIAIRAELISNAPAGAPGTSPALRVISINRYVKSVRYPTMPGLLKVCN
ncbi:MAG TPA: hypothetical protein VFS25_19715 [Chitinophaga sp.]|uniref:hypothetical protein n=1 Tax=Chitinophaga sp. TaxID=1869181 RepID=UPI002DB6D402|nr:hypothetical protein [Chitinophaga sp.]HEU4555087.1 hypothetical protein [Chitinophaga sp.]